MIWLLALSAFASPGTYRLDLSSASEAKVPVLGWQRSETRSVSLVTWAEGGSWSHHVCSAEIHDNAPLARTELPPAFIDHLPLTRARVKATGDRLRVDLGVEVVGWDPAITGALPTGPDDPGVVDHEGDGRPGATVWVHISGLGSHAIEVAQVSQVVLEGSRSESGWTGTLTTIRLEQVVLGADKKMLDKTLELRPKDAESHFSLVKTAASTCDELLRSDLADDS